MHSARLQGRSRCGVQTEATFCTVGRWSKHPDTLECLCPPLPDVDDGEYVCIPSLPGVGQHVEGRNNKDLLDDTLSGNTFCLFLCNGHPKTELTCRDGGWTVSPDIPLTCHEHAAVIV